MNESKQIITRAIDLEEGQVIIYPCSTKAHQESVRVMLYRQRRIIAEKGFKFDFKISATTMEGKPVITVEKIPVTDQIFIFNKDGTMTAEQLSDTDPVRSFIGQAVRNAPSAEERRIAELQRIDGWNEEEIAWFRETGMEPASVQARRNSSDCAPDLNPVGDI